MNFERQLLVWLALLAAVSALSACGGPGPETNPGTTTGTVPTCGDGAIGSGEVCDGPSLGDQTCEALGFGPGSLACQPDCTAFDPSGCGAPSTCPNGKKDGAEVCDGADLGGASCTSLGYGSGALACAANCAAFDTSGCAAPASCGDGKKDGNEACDGADLAGASCTTLGKGPGTLACAANCAAFDTSGCACLPACGSLACGPDPVCGASCGTCDAMSECQAGSCVQVCDLLPIQASGILNVDLPMVTLSGTVTLNGATMPSDPDLDGNGRGWIKLRNVDTGNEVYGDLGETGPGTYAIKTFAGTYDVLVLSNYAYYQSVLPGYQETVVSKGLSITASGTHDLDLKMVTLSGTVTLNGATMPSDPDLDGNGRGWIKLRNVDTGDEVYGDLGETGPGTYAIKTFAGTYDVLVLSNYAYYQSVLPGYQETVVSRGLSITASGTHDLDLKMVTLSGTVTLNGATMPSDPDLDGNGRGWIKLRNVDTGDEVYGDLGETGPGTYAIKTFAGTYDVLVLSNYAYYQSVLPGYQETVVSKGLSITASGTHDLDLKMVTLSGTVTLNGATMPSDPDLDGNGRGWIKLRNVDTGDEVYGDLGETGPGTYAIKTFAGTYDVLVLSNYAYYQSVLPGYQETVVSKGLSITASGTHDLDLKMVTLSGTVTLNGATMPSDPDLDGNGRGWIKLRNVDTGDEVYGDLGETGPGTYAIKTFAGTYDVLVLSNYAYYQSVLPGYQETVVSRGLSITASGTHDLDLKMVTLSGTVTLNGATMPSDPDLDGNGRGWIKLRNVDTGDEVYGDLGETGPGTYAIKTFAGAYDVLVLSNYAYYQSVLPGYQETRVEKGCAP